MGVFRDRRSDELGPGALQPADRTWVADAEFLADHGHRLPDRHGRNVLPGHAADATAAAPTGVASCAPPPSARFRSYRAAGDAEAQVR